jgi:hypothetical protein
MSWMEQGALSRSRSIILPEQQSHAQHRTLYRPDKSFSYPNGKRKQTRQDSVDLTSAAAAAAATGAKPFSKVHRGP